MKQIILASSSPRRKELLRQHRINFIVDYQEIDEVLDMTLALPLRLEKLAYQKAYPIALKYPKDVVIGSDTMVCLEDKMLGKPRDRQDAFRMLKYLADRTQIVYSAVAIIDDHQVTTFHDLTKVRFKALSDQEINDYLDLNEWQGKAGGYAIQGEGSRLVAKIDGDIETVIGLPVKKLIEYFKTNEIL
ncbi:nucleoside triphosphate pyrophosphatase [Thomasclavelia sp.]|uniref:Maf family protein n=1 Tax=Thomasclavelia sp. TaxID=3025757 RepID=UPI0025FF8C49|nr:Maf family protein [Thomasclavelia sp.]